VGDDEGHSSCESNSGSWHCCFEMLGAGGQAREPNCRWEEPIRGDSDDDGDSSSMAHRHSLYESVIDYKCVLFAF
jgi:hypothetical protein